MVFCFKYSLEKKEKEEYENKLKIVSIKLSAALK